jgi:uncharacterized membrane protein
MTLAEADHERQILQTTVTLDEDRGSLRHRTVANRTKVLTWLIVALVDLPLSSWITSSIFNVDWSDPLGLPLLITGVVAILSTAGAAWVLYHLGHNRRESKNERRQLDWATLSFTSKVSLLAVTVLVGLISAVMFTRVYTEALLSNVDGFSGLALLLSLLVAFVMLLSAALVFCTAFRDGSPEQADLAFYGDLVHQGRRRQLAHETDVLRHHHALAMHLGHSHKDTGDEPASVLGVTQVVENQPALPEGQHASEMETGTQEQAMPAARVASRQRYGLRRPAA